MTYDLRNAEKAMPARVKKSIEDNRSVLPLDSNTKSQDLISI